MPQDDELLRAIIPSSQPLPWIVEDLDFTNFGVPSDDDLDESTVSAAHISPAGHNLIIDSDFGVDDTVAVAALLSLVQGIAHMDDEWDIQGLVTVAGVTTVENAAYNARLLLCQYGLTDEDIPVIRGADKPRKKDLSNVGKLIHGPDGLWWLAQLSQQQGLDEKCRPDESLFESSSEEDATHFYCEHAQLSNATLLVLGPLTNVANAMRECKKSFTKADGLELVVLGGVDMAGIETPPAGNESPIIGKKTPVTEYNFWQDPESARYVFNVAKPKNPGDDPKLNITLIPQNTFDQYVISPEEIDALATSSNAVGNWLTVPYYKEPYTGSPGPLPVYVGTQARNQVPPAVPDLVAAAYTVDQAVRSSAIVTPSVVTVFGASTKASKFVSGQSLIAQSVFGPKIDPETGTPIGFGWNGTTEQIAQVYGDDELSALADTVFANGEPFNANEALLEAFIIGAIMRPPNNAQVVAKIHPKTVSEFLLKTLTPDFAPLAGASSISAGEETSRATEFDEQIFLPLVGTE